MNDAYLQPYHAAQARHGNTFEATLWANPKTQKLRFDVFAEIVDFTGKRVLDAGCSRGDFAAYLTEHGIAYDTYVGVDGVPDVLDYARQRRLPDATFVHGDFVKHPDLLATGDPDIIAISGSLNTMDPPVAMRVLEGAWDAAGEALIFNFLSDRASKRAVPQAHPARRLPTLELLKWAFAQTAAVRFRQDYFTAGHDATILMSREPAAATSSLLDFF